jgi:hypothetical protein
MEDALYNHKQVFPSYHRNIKSIQFLSAAPIFTEKIARQEFRNAVEPEESEEEE